MPGGRVVAVWQLVVGNVAVHSVEPPEVKVTVPVASSGSPVIERVSCMPNAIVDGAANSVIDVSASVTVKLAPVATPPV